VSAVAVKKALPMAVKFVCNSAVCLYAGPKMYAIKNCVLRASLVY